MSINRRQFLGLSGAAVAATVLTPGLRLIELAQARSPEEAVTSLHRWGLLIDSSKCADGCTACVSACADENGIQNHGRPATDAQWIRKVTLKDKQTGHRHTLPLMCLHWEHPPCVEVCPTHPAFRRS